MDYIENYIIVNEKGELLGKEEREYLNKCFEKGRKIFYRNLNKARSSGTVDKLGEEIFDYALELYKNKYGYKPKTVV